MKATPPTVQAIIVTWNKKKDVLSLLSQLKMIQYPDDRLSILVVDNASTDGTVQAIETDHPDITLIKHRQNRGGAGGFNAGMRWTLNHRPEVDYFWLLDNDVLLDPGALRGLVRVMKKNSRAAICGSKIMDVDSRDRLIELGAFIDYRQGEVRRNAPGPSRLKDPDTVFKVDYVAACSLLARTTAIRETGIWQEDLFIYWDDMEWGARFNAAGYEVLATNDSVVYHPAWAERTYDQSAVWRSYYRVRNGLFFFNHYTGGISRRLLLSKMVGRYLKIARKECMHGNDHMSRAFRDGVADFFHGRFGQKQLDNPPVNSFEKMLGDEPIGKGMLFIADARVSRQAIRYLSRLHRPLTANKLHCIVPDSESERWAGLGFVDQVLSYRRFRNGKIPLPDRFRMLKFLYQSRWTVFLASVLTPKIGSIWGKKIIRIDFKSGHLISTGRLQVKMLLQIQRLALLCRTKALFSPPSKRPLTTVMEMDCGVSRPCRR